MNLNFDLKTFKRETMFVPGATSIPDSRVWDSVRPALPMMGRIQTVCVKFCLNKKLWNEDIFWKIDFMVLNSQFVKLFENSKIDHHLSK